MGFGFLQDEKDYRYLYICFFFFRRRKTVDICTNFIVFLQEKETVNICNNFIVFLQDEKDNADMCTNF